MSKELREKKRPIPEEGSQRVDQRWGAGHLNRAGAAGVLSEVQARVEIIFVEESGDLEYNTFDECDRASIWHPLAAVEEVIEDPKTRQRRSRGQIASLTSAPFSLLQLRWGSAAYSRFGEGVASATRAR
jgi:hypothetical protein